MQKIHVRNARDGMVCAQDVYAASQLLLQENTMLMGKNIARLSFYDVEYIFIKKEWVECEHFEIEEEMTVEAKNYVQAVSNILPKIKEGFQAIVNDHAKVDTDNFVAMIREIITENRRVIRMLPTMRTLKDMEDITYIHSINVSLISYLFGKWIKLGEQELNVLILAGLLHDIGKLQTPREIIQKPARLTEEFKIIQEHPILGYNILKEKDIDERIKEAALSHHERCDGSGYPYKLCSSFIPTFAKIVAIADVYDAMTANRIHRDGLCPFDVIDIFETEGLQQFDVQLIMMLLTKIAENHINERVRLTDGRIGKIVLLNKERLAKPVVQLEKGFIDLSKQNGLYIAAVLGE